MALTSSGVNPSTGSVHRRHGINLVRSLSDRDLIVAATVIRVQRCGSADRASRHEAVKDGGSTPQSLREFLKEIIDMVGTQNEKTKRFN